MRRSMVLAMMATALVLTGCAASDSAGVAALDTERTGSDVLPAHLKTDVLTAGSERLIAEQGGWQFYLAKPSDPGNRSGLCVVFGSTSNADLWTTGCFTGTIDDSICRTTNKGEMCAWVLPDGQDPSSELKQGWQQIHANLLVHGL